MIIIPKQVLCMEGLGCYDYIVETTIQTKTLQFKDEYNCSIYRRRLDYFSWVKVIYASKSLFYLCSKLALLTKWTDPHMKVKISHSPFTPYHQCSSKATIGPPSQ